MQFVFHDASEGAWTIWGLIPSFLDESDPRDARAQIDERYVSGWRPFREFIFDPLGRLCYPGDPPLSPLASMLFRDERLTIYPYAWVVWQRGDEWEVARID